MPTQPVGDEGHGDEHDSEQQVVAGRARVQQHGIGCFVDDKARRRDQEEPGGRAGNRRTVATEAEPVVACERDREGHQPPDQVGPQRVPAQVFHQHDDDSPMNGSGHAANPDEPQDAAGRAARQGTMHSATQVSAAREQGKNTVVCLCVDDFGLHSGVNDAALRLAGMARVHAIGSLVGAPAWKCGVPGLRQLDGEGLDVGLHLDLTEYPLLPGSRKPLRSLIAASFTRQIDRQAMRAEIQAQLNTFEAAIGHGPAFVDGHQHVHQFPVVRAELLAELTHRYGQQAPWIRSTRRARQPRAQGVPRASAFKATLIEWLGSQGLAALTRQLGIQQNSRLLGVYDFQGGPARYRTLLRTWLGAARDGDLLMCHPGLGVKHSDGLNAARESEYQVLSSPQFDELLQANGIALWPMSRILARQAMLA